MLYIIMRADANYKAVGWGNGPVGELLVSIQCGMDIMRSHT